MSTNYEARRYEMISYDYVLLSALFSNTPLMWIPGALFPGIDSPKREGG
jgi:hypothetical protein